MKGFYDARTILTDAAYHNRDEGASSKARERTGEALCPVMAAIQSLPMIT